MLSMFEKQVGAGPAGPHNTSRLSRPVSIILIVVTIIVALYITFFLLPFFSDESLNATPKSSDIHRPRAEQHNERHPLPVEYKPRKTRDPELKPDESDGLAPPKDGHDSRDHVQDSSPWGYNKNRNIPRWKAIRESIENDFRDMEKGKGVSAGNFGIPLRKGFVLVDYGSDAGYFGINAALVFKRRGIFVLSVEKGGVGGEIWKSRAEKDVLQVQEYQAAKWSVEQNFMICQTTLSHKMFFQLNDMQEAHRYQLVLSVFHWFDLPTRKDFEAAVVALFKNAQTTFIELPTIGDGSRLIRKQVGWDRFRVWYDNRTDIQQILEDAGELQNFPIKVTLVKSVPWLKWTRDVFRVDWDLRALAERKKKRRMDFHCATRREIYQCKQRYKLQRCHDVVAGDGKTLGRL